MPAGFLSRFYERLIMYEVLQGSSPDEIQTKVNARMKDGWEVTGGLTVVFCGQAIYRYFQAVVNDRPPPQQKQQEQKKG